MDRETAIRLFNLINTGPAVGVSSDNDIISDVTLLGATLNLLGKPTYISKVLMPAGEKVTRTLPNGQKYTTDRDWDAKPAARFLREWADAMDPPAHTGPMLPSAAQRIAFLNALTLTHNHSYTPKSENEQWLAHDWVVCAIQEAYDLGRTARGHV